MPVYLDGPLNPLKGARSITGPPYRFIHDPGHGWLEVTHAELVALGIAHSISAFSFTTGPRPGGVSALVYLEEDCDLARFAAAKGWTPRDAWSHWREVYQEKTFIRKLARYSPPAPPAARPQRDLHGDLADEAMTLQTATAADLDPGHGEG